MKKKYFIIISVCMLTLSGCKTSYEFIITGKQYPPRAKDAPVKMVFLEDREKYEEIGIAEITGKSLMQRVDAAVDVTRRYGGDVLMMKGIRDENMLKEMKEVEEKKIIKQSFLVLKTRTEDAEALREDADEPIIKSGKAPGKTAKRKSGTAKRSISIKNSGDPGKVDLGEGELDETDSNAMRRATWKLLVNDFEMLHGERFRGTMYPVKYSKKIPRGIDYHSDETKRLVTLATHGRRHQAYLLVPRKMEKRITRIIKLKQSLDFVYTPVDVYQSRGKKYPVLEFVKEIVAEGKE